MATEQWSQIISTSVVPVVIISACGLLCLALYSRLATIVGRLRQFQQERVAELEAYARQRVRGEQDRISAVRHRRMVELFEAQTRSVLRRGRLIRLALMCLLGTIVLLTLCSLLTGLSIAWAEAIYPAVGLFVGAMILLMIGMLAALIELRASLDPVQLKGEMVTRLARELDQVIDEGTRVPPTEHV